jgi:hypothetical protein
VGKSSPSQPEYVTLRSVVDQGTVDTSSLRAIIDDEEVIIISILTNTAVYVSSSNQAVRKLESVEKITVKKSDIFYLPVKESVHPYSKSRTKK